MPRLRLQVVGDENDKDSSVFASRFEKPTSALVYSGLPAVTGRLGYHCRQPGHNFPSRGGSPVEGQPALLEL